MNKNECVLSVDCVNCKCWRWIFCYYIDACRRKFMKMDGLCLSKKADFMHENAFEYFLCSAMENRNTVLYEERKKGKFESATAIFSFLSFFFFFHIANRIFFVLWISYIVKCWNKITSIIDALKCAARNVVQIADILFHSVHWVLVGCVRAYVCFFLLASI